MTFFVLGVLHTSHLSGRFIYHDFSVCQRMIIQICSFLTAKVFSLTSLHTNVKHQWNPPSGTAFFFWVAVSRRIKANGKDYRAVNLSVGMFGIICMINLRMLGLPGMTLNMGVFNSLMQSTLESVRPPPGLEPKESTRFWKDAGPRKNSSNLPTFFCQSQMLESFDISR